MRFFRQPCGFEVPDPPADGKDWGTVLARLAAATDGYWKDLQNEVGLPRVQYGFKELMDLDDLGTKGSYIETLWKEHGVQARIVQDSTLDDRREFVASVSRTLGVGERVAYYVDPVTGGSIAKERLMLARKFSETDYNERASNSLCDPEQVASCEDVRNWYWTNSQALCGLVFRRSLSDFKRTVVKALNIKFPGAAQGVPVLFREQAAKMKIWAEFLLDADNKKKYQPESFELCSGWAVWHGAEMTRGLVLARAKMMNQRIGDADTTIKNAFRMRVPISVLDTMESRPEFYQPRPGEKGENAEFIEYTDQRALVHADEVVYRMPQDEEVDHCIELRAGLIPWYTKRPWKQGDEEFAPHLHTYLINIDLAATASSSANGGISKEDIRIIEESLNAASTARLRFSKPGDGAYAHICLDVVDAPPNADKAYVYRNSKEETDWVLVLPVEEDNRLPQDEKDFLTRLREKPAQQSVDIVVQPAIDGSTNAPKAFNLIERLKAGTPGSTETRKRLAFGLEKFFEFESYQSIDHLFRRLYCGYAFKGEPKKSDEDGYEVEQSIFHTIGNFSKMWLWLKLGTESEAKRIRLTKHEHIVPFDILGDNPRVCIGDKSLEGWSRIGLFRQFDLWHEFSQSSEQGLDDKSASPLASEDDRFRVHSRAGHPFQLVLRADHQYGFTKEQCYPEFVLSVNKPVAHLGLLNTGKAESDGESKPGDRKKSFLSYDYNATKNAIELYLSREYVLQSFGWNLSAVPDTPQAPFQPYRDLYEALFDIDWTGRKNKSKLYLERWVFDNTAYVPKTDLGSATGMDMETDRMPGISDALYRAETKSLPLHENPAWNAKIQAFLVDGRQTFGGPSKPIDCLIRFHARLKALVGDRSFWDTPVTLKFEDWTSEFNRGWKADDCKTIVENSHVIRVGLQIERAEARCPKAEHFVDGTQNCVGIDPSPTITTEYQTVQSDKLLAPSRLLLNTFKYSERQDAKQKDPKDLDTDHPAHTTGLPEWYYENLTPFKSYTYALHKVRGNPDNPTLTDLAEHMRQADERLNRYFGFVNPDKSDVRKRFEWLHYRCAYDHSVIGDRKNESDFRPDPTKPDYANWREALLGPAYEFAVMPRGEANPNCTERQGRGPHLRFFTVPLACRPQWANYAGLGDRRSTLEFLWFLMETLQALADGDVVRTVKITYDESSATNAQARLNAMKLRKEAAKWLANLVTHVEDDNELDRWQGFRRWNEQKSQAPEDEILAEQKLIKHVHHLRDHALDLQFDSPSAIDAIRSMFEQDLRLFQRAKGFALHLFDGPTYVDNSNYLYSGNVYRLTVTKRIEPFARTKLSSTRSDPNKEFPVKDNMIDRDEFPYTKFLCRGNDNPEYRFVVEALDDARYDNEFQIVKDQCFALSAEEVIEGAQKERGKAPKLSPIKVTAKHHNPEWRKRNADGSVPEDGEYYLLPSRRPPSKPLKVGVDRKNTSPGGSALNYIQHAIVSRPDKMPPNPTNLETQRNIYMEHAPWWAFANMSEVHLEDIGRCELWRECYDPENLYLPFIEQPDGTVKNSNLPMRATKDWWCLDSYLSHHYFVIEPDEEASVINPDDIDKIFANDVFQFEVEELELDSEGRDTEGKDLSVTALENDALRKWFKYRQAITGQGAGADETAKHEPNPINIFEMKDLLEEELQKALFGAPPVDTACNTDPPIRRDHYNVRIVDPEKLRPIQPLHQRCTRSGTPTEENRYGKIVGLSVLKLPKNDDGSYRYAIRLSLLGNCGYHYRVRSRVIRNERDFDGDGDADMNPEFVMESEFSGWSKHGPQFNVFTGAQMPLCLAVVPSVDCGMEEWHTGKEDFDAGDPLGTLFRSENRHLYWSSEHYANVVSDYRRIDVSVRKRIEEIDSLYSLGPAPTVRTKRNAAAVRSFDKNVDILKSQFDGLVPAKMLDRFIGIDLTVSFVARSLEVLKIEEWPFEWRK
jgi:hypothetical protein